MNTDVGIEDPVPPNGDWRTAHGRTINPAFTPSPIAAMSVASYSEASLIVSGDGSVLKDRSGKYGDRIDPAQMKEADWIIDGGKAWDTAAWLEFMQESVAAGNSTFAGALAPLPVDVWWTELTESDVGRTTPKMLEYSGDDQKGVDMVAIGREMADMGNLKCPEGVDEAQWLAEIGIHFYIRGKLARSMAAFRSGKMPSDDTVFDIRIYSVMWQRCRDVGFWG